MWISGSNWTEYGRQNPKILRFLLKSAALLVIIISRALLIPPINHVGSVMDTQLQHLADNYMIIIEAAVR